MEAMEELLLRSSEILRAHKVELWLHKEDLIARSSQRIQYHREEIWKSHENLKQKSSELLASITETISKEQRNAEGIIVNMSALLYERPRHLADHLKSNLISNLAILIFVCLITGLSSGYGLSEATEIALLFFVISVAAYLVHRISTAAAPPVLFYKQGVWIGELLEQCPSLFAPYKPTLLWGWNGHLQTIVLGKIGRSVDPILPKAGNWRRSFRMVDGATMYYDTFEPPFCKPIATILLVPGIANTSEKLYVKTFVRCALGSAYRVVVLNHLGALKDHPITTPRIFGYGHTEDLAALVDVVHEKYPDSSKILIGFSMGGNIVAKYLGEESLRQGRFVGCVAVCQGYDAYASNKYLLSWERLARFYNWAITDCALKQTINRHGKVLFQLYDQRKVAAATCIQDIDVSVMSKMYGFGHIDDMYRKWSSSGYLENIKIPLMTLNAVDDPVIDPKCNDIPMRLACQNDNVLHVQTQCGGHLGFYTGGWLIPDGISWMDTCIMEYCNAVIKLAKVQE